MSETEPCKPASTGTPLPKDSEQYILPPEAEALRLKWAAGRQKYGPTFQGHPLLELNEELLDAMNYVDEAARQGYHLPGCREELSAMRAWVRRVYLARKP